MSIKCPCQWMENVRFVQFCFAAANAWLERCWHQTGVWKRTTWAVCCFGTVISYNSHEVACTMKKQINKNKQVSSTHTHKQKYDTNTKVLCCADFVLQLPACCTLAASQWFEPSSLPISPAATTARQPMRTLKMETNGKEVCARNDEKQWGSIIVQRHTILLIWRLNLLANKTTVVDVSCSLETLLHFHPLVYSTPRSTLNWKSASQPLPILDAQFKLKVGYATRLVQCWRKGATHTSSQGQSLWWPETRADHCTSVERLPPETWTRQRNPRDQKRERCVQAADSGESTLPTAHGRPIKAGHIGSSSTTFSVASGPAVVVGF